MLLALNRLNSNTPLPNNIMNVNPYNNRGTMQNGVRRWAINAERWVYA